MIYVENTGRGTYNVSCIIQKVGKFFDCMVLLKFGQLGCRKFSVVNIPAERCELAGVRRVSLMGLPLYLHD